MASVSVTILFSSLATSILLPVPVIAEGKLDQSRWSNFVFPFQTDCQNFLLLDLKPGNNWGVDCEFFLSLAKDLAVL